jgi:1-acyl-sn-glycerol-3-phosphate acyltransferase
MKNQKMKALMRTFKVLNSCYQTLQEAKACQGELTTLKGNWAADVLGQLNVNLQVIGKAHHNTQQLFVGNHLSYLDIPILISATKDIAFLAKHEINHWPIFGAAARLMKTVFVKRESGSSRKAARQSIREALEQGQRLVIFPSGTTCLHEKKPWRQGCFELAQERGIPIQPFRLSYQPQRAVAYIDKDFFPTHLYKLVGLGQIHAKIEFHEPVLVNHPTRDAEYWQNWSKFFLD